MILIFIRVHIKISYLIVPLGNTNLRRVSVYGLYTCCDSSMICDVLVCYLCNT
ncbi:hypothetical protein HanRHA438_Chr04g0173291 [Helianthus annuus]|nr:hypothetical protein HanRHA438_Chr04g0173291 [Helianthus annuus]